MNQRILGPTKVAMLLTDVGFLLLFPLPFLACAFRLGGGAAGVRPPG